MLHLSPRDRALLQLLDRTPVTAPLVLRASCTFAGEPFRDERRVRERLQHLTDEGLVRRFQLGQWGGGASNYYKLTARGFSLVNSAEATLPSRAYFMEIPLSRMEHTLSLAEIIVQTLVCAHRDRIAVTRFHRENELSLEVATYSQRPDFHVQLLQAGRTFNILVELDRGNESVDSVAEQAIRQKILGYEAYQDMVWQAWKQGGKRGPRPYFKVAFLTSSAIRAQHILFLAGQLARNPDRRLCYAAATDEFLASGDPLREPLFLDHSGHWRALVNLYPSSTSVRTPVRIGPPAQPLIF